MRISSINERDYLLAAHLFFDFSWARWQEFWRQEPHEDPFRVACLHPWLGNSQRRPADWQSALEISQNYPEQRLCFNDPDYPKQLARLEQAPPVLYKKGSAIPMQQSLVSIVGTRKSSDFGTTNAAQLTHFFVQRGLGIVSGLARGIDGIAHEQCLREKGYTLAVLGTGLERIYPREHQRLAEKILENGGTLLSQFPPGSIPHPSHFPRRNKIIAAISAGTIAVEGAMQSGAFITARAAMDISLTAVVLTRDYRTEFGKGAIQLVRTGAFAMTDFTDAYAAIALPHGGMLRPLPNSKNSHQENQLTLPFEFTAYDFQNAYGLRLPEAIAQIEILKAEGKLLANPLGTFRFALE